MTSDQKYTFVRKPKKCPVCQSSGIADILYGMPIFSEEQERLLETGKIVLGGCILHPDNPRWRCIDCDTDFYQV